CGLNWFVMRSGPSMGRLRLLEAEQALPHHEEIRQRAGDDEPMPVLGQATVADLGEAEDAFDHADRMLDPRAHTGLPWLKDTAALPFFRTGAKPNMRMQDGWKRHWLCRACEDRSGASRSCSPRSCSHWSCTTCLYRIDTATGSRGS